MEWYLNTFRLRTPRRGVTPFHSLDQYPDLHYTFHLPKPCGAGTATIIAEASLRYIRLYIEYRLWLRAG